MIQRTHGRSPRQLLHYGCAAALACLLAACATPLPIQSDAVPPGSLRLAQVTAMVKPAEIARQQELQDAVRAAGIGDRDLVDGRIVMARVHRSGGPAANGRPEQETVRMLYVPKGVEIALGDIVEVRTGRPPEKGEAGRLNLVTRLVQRYATVDAHCWWDGKGSPPARQLLYCDWMAGEGWLRQEGADPAWFKPQTTVTAGK